MERGCTIFSVVTPLENVPICGQALLWSGRGGGGAVRYSADGDHVRLVTSSVPPPHRAMCDPIHGMHAQQSAQHRLPPRPPSAAQPCHCHTEIAQVYCSLTARTVFAVGERLTEHLNSVNEQQNTRLNCVHSFLARCYTCAASCKLSPLASRRSTCSRSVDSVFVSRVCSNRHHSHQTGELRSPPGFSGKTTAGV